MKHRRPKYAPEHSMKQIIDAEQAVLAYIYAHGFIDHGNVDPYLEFTTSGIPVQLGGRKRYVLPGTNLRVTVGPKITLFYTVRGEDCTFLKKLPTIEVTKIQRALSAILISGSIEPHG